MVLLVLVIYYLTRGRTDYRALKDMLSERDVAQALVQAEQGNEQAAIALLEKAGARTPNNPVVLHALADFNEPRQDPMTLYALRKLVNNGAADEATKERLCRLAFDWSHPELADTPTLKEWALSDPSKLELHPLELSARWLALRGQGQAAEQRLRQALAQAHGVEAVPAVEVFLSRLLLSSPIAQSGQPELLKESVDLIERALATTEPPAAIHGDAARLLASIVLRPDWVKFVSAASQERLATMLAAYADAVENQGSATDKNQSVGTEFRLLELAVRGVMSPGQRREMVQDYLARTKEHSLKLRAMGVRWLIDHDLSDLALEACEQVPDSRTVREWFVLRADALFALKRWDELRQDLAVPTQPLPEIVKALFLLTIDKSSGADEATLKQRRDALEDSAPRAEFKESLYVAGVLERMHEFPTAIDLYSGLKNHAQAGFQARFGLVRCLREQLERPLELMQALDSLLVLWPGSDEARSDLAYLRLLDKTHRPEDVQTVIKLAQDNPWYLAYRIPAALALLRINDAPRALALLDQAGVPWDLAQPGWQAVYAAVLAANERTVQAQQRSAQLTASSLRPGEAKLLADYLLTPGK